MSSYYISLTNHINVNPLLSNSAKQEPHVIPTALLMM